MAELQLLFADVLAQAIAEGRKTVTRRPITRRNSYPLWFPTSQVEGEIGGFGDLDWDAHLITAEGRERPPGASPHTDRCIGRDYCCSLVDGQPEQVGGGGYVHIPGVGGETRQRVFCRTDPGDLLVVRECWALVTAVRGLEPYVERCDCEGKRGGVYCPEHDEVQYRGQAKVAAPGGWDNVEPHERPPWARWRSSTHMPRWAARSVRRIVSVRPELVGAEPLSQVEAEAEGFGSPEEFAAMWVAVYGDKPRWAWRYQFDRETMQP